MVKCWAVIKPVKDEVIDSERKRLVQAKKTAKEVADSTTNAEKTKAREAKLAAAQERLAKALAKNKEAQEKMLARAKVIEDGTKAAAALKATGVITTDGSAPKPAAVAAKKKYKGRRASTRRPFSLPTHYAMKKSILIATSSAATVNTHIAFAQMVSEEALKPAESGGITMTADSLTEAVLLKYPTLVYKRALLKTRAGVLLDKDESSIQWYANSWIDRSYVKHADHEDYRQAIKLMLELGS